VSTTSKTIDLEIIEQLILAGYITKRSHTSGEIFIYNYTAKAQYEKVWTPETMQCRGLILDTAGTVVARPLPKFFNLEEHAAGIPNEPFEVYEKLDGSLGIVYWHHGQPFIASRGSFDSDQAIKANQLLHSIYADTIAKLDPTLTYLVEIIYPENRIVVNYGTQQVLVLLAVIETATGIEIPLEQFTDLGLAIAKKYDGIADLGEITKLNEDNREGFVIRFASGLRLKFKFADYVRLHRVLTQISTKVIWEMLKDQQPFEQILEHVPDEFYDWVKGVKAGLIEQYEAIEAQARRDFKDLSSFGGDRKATAMYFLTCPHHKILFAMLDGKDYSDYVWRLIKPVTEKPFVKDEES